MSIDNAVSRRGILAAGAGVTGAAVLAACSGGSSDSKAADGRGADVISPAASTPAGSSGAAGGSTASSAPAGASAGASAGKSLVTLATLAVGSSRAVTLADGKPAVVTRTGTASVVCFSAVCTHQGCTVKPKGDELACPCHGSSFDARTGTVLGGPAPSPLPRVDVAVSGGAVIEAE